MINIERLCLGCMNDNGGEKICPMCSFDNTEQNPQGCLPLKFVLNNRFLVGKVISTDLEGISYIGWDNGDDSVVTVKEYFPKDSAHRNPDKTVSMIEGNEYTFNEGLLEFLEINRIIKESELPSLMPVKDVFEENGTVYSVTDSVSGITLKEFLDKNGGTLKWEQARTLFLPLIDTIKGMNDNGIIHGNISENTIIVGRDGKLRLSGFSIKRMSLENPNGENTIEDGFAAVEQYNFEGMHIDTYTDVYGLSVTLFKVLIGSVPQTATIRIQNDSMSIPARFAEELPRHVLAALANGLQVMPQNRTKDIETFKNQLVYGEIEAPVTKSAKNSGGDEDKASSKKKKKSGSAKYVVISAVCTAVVFLGIAAALIFTVFKEDVFGKEEQPTNNSASIDAPQVESIGTVESGAEVSAKLYDVPNFKGKYYSDIIENDEYEMFKFVITDKTFSNDCKKGTVVSQSVEAGKGVTRDTEIQLVLSLGPKEVKIASVVGNQKTDAIIELLRQGFLYENITFEEKYDSNKEPGVVLEQTPEYSESVSTDVKVTLYINSYEGEQDQKNNSSNR